MEYREVTPALVLDWNRTESPLIRVRIARDVVPGGLAMAMAPMFVKWQSAPAFGHDDYYIVQNVNVVNNPVGGVLVLGTLKVFTHSVESVEFVGVTTKVKRDTPFGHAMLRFIFKEDRRPVILDHEGRPLTNDAEVSDIVLSWEAWRPPDATFNPVSGLDPATYALTPRCLLGAVRCVTDSVLDRPWHCYPIKLPEVANAHDEMLYSCFAFADAVARRTVAHLLEQRFERGQPMFSDYSEASDGDWNAVSDYHRDAQLSDQPIRDLLDGKISYHLLERSCITMALLSLDWGNLRVHRKAGLPEPKRVQVAPESLPSLVSDLVSGERTPLLLRVPAALHWIMNKQSVIVGKAHEVLDEVGLLEHRLGRVVKKDYDTRCETPYGSIGENIIY